MSKKIIIDGMTCNHCVKNVKENLEALDGITKVEVKVGEANVDGSISDEQIKDTIEDLGFDILSIE